MARSDAQVVIRVTGKGAVNLFANEAGAHRWQRKPPTESGGRTHSSTITVAVLSENKSGFEIRNDDLEFKFCRGSGPGGQKRNKTDTCAIVTHIPTGERVRCDDECSQSTNKQRAVSILKARLHASHSERQSRSKNKRRQNQIGSGMRSDKTRTISVKNNRVIQHTNGKKTTVEKYRRGRIDLLGD